MNRTHASKKKKEAKLSASQLSTRYTTPHNKPTLAQSNKSTLTKPNRGMSVKTPPPRRNLPKNKLNPTTSPDGSVNNNKKKNTNQSNSPAFYQDYVSVMKDELNELNNAENPLPQLQADSAIEIELDPTKPLTPQQLASIYGERVKMHLPDIPLNGAQAYWALEADPNNPFTFPIFNLTTLLQPTDLSVSIDPKDSDVAVDKIFDDYQSMMATTIQQGGQSKVAKGGAYNLNQTEFTQDDLDTSLSNIANPHRSNPLQQMASAHATSAGIIDSKDGATQAGQSAQMATSRVKFGQTIVITTPVRKSQLDGIKKVFKITPQGEIASNTVNQVTPTNDEPHNTNPLNNIICLTKASQSNKRFDVFLSRAKKNPTADSSKLSMETIQSLMGGLGNTSGVGEGEESEFDQSNKTALLFTSNISHNSLLQTRNRLNKQSQDIITALAKQGKTYNPPFEEHVCMERNYLIELERDPMLVKFPFSSHDPNKHDPVTHMLTFPMRASTVTFATNDPLDEPSNDLNFRLAEAEFLIQCCLMGQNFPAPIDPRFAPLIDQDRNMELTPEESQKAREVIGRSVVAMYGHGSGIAAQRWSLKRPMIKEELYKQPIPPQSSSSSSPPLRQPINYELELSYAHNDFYHTLYTFALLPSEDEIQQNLNKLKKQMLDMSSSNQEILDRISKETSEVFGEDGPIDRHAGSVHDIDLSTMTAEEIENEFQSRMKQIEQRQYHFQQQLDEQMRMEAIQRSRASASGLNPDDDDYEYEYEYTEADNNNDIDIDHNNDNNHNNNLKHNSHINDKHDDDDNNTVVDLDIVRKD